MVHLQHELVQYRPEPRTFEDALRDALGNAPYLGAALFVHAIVLLILAALDAPPPELARELAITSSEQRTYDEIPEPPKKQEEPLDEPDEVEDTVVEVSDPPLDDSEPTDDFDLAPDSIFGPPGPDSTLGVSLDTGGPGGGDLPGGDRPGPGNPLPLDSPVRRGLEWLAHHQNPDGHWSAAAFDAECGNQGDDVICSGSGNPMHDVGVTGLALLAFLGAGNTDKHGEFRDNVHRGLKYLADVQQSDGNFADPNSGQHTYDHLLATLAFLDAYGHSRLNRHLRRPALDGLRYVERIRNPGGAWRYADFHPEMGDPTRRNDTSVTGWAILVLATARDAGLPIDETALEDALLFLDEMTDPSTGRTGYTRPGERPARLSGKEALWPETQSEALTAVALMARIFADPELKRPGHRELVDRGARLIASMPPTWNADEPGRRDFYFWYYGTYALFQYQDVDKQPWLAWEARMADAIAAHQHLDGERRGSWDPELGPWGHVGGRVYSTAILTLALEVYYRYPVLGSR